MEYRIVQGLVGLVLVGALVVFTAFPQLKPAWIQIGTGRGPRATNTLFNRSGAFGGRSAEDCLERGAAYIIEEQWDRAIKELTEAIRLEPKSAEAYYFRGVAWQSQEEFGKALGDFDAALRESPEDPEALYSRAECKSELGQSAAAIADLDAVIRLTPEDPTAWCLRGNLREESRDYPGAVADYQQAVNLDNEDPQGLNCLAWVLATAPDAKLRDGARAVKLAQRAVEFDGGRNWDSLDTLAAAQAETGNFAAAVRNQTSALAFAPQEEQVELKSRLQLYQAQRPFRLP